MKTWGIFLFKTLICVMVWHSQISSLYSKAKNMDAKVNFNVMESIETMDQFSKDSKLRQALFEAFENEVNLLSNYLQLNDIETILFPNAFVLWFENSSFSEVFEYLG